MSTKEPMIKNLRLDKETGKFSCDFQFTESPGEFYSAVCGFPLFLIRNAQRKGCDFEDLVDGFSGIRDSSDAAVEKMLERAINFLKLTV